MTVFIRDYDAPIRKFTLRKNGRWVADGESMRSHGGLGIGHRDYYRDPSF